ncbi:CHAP domain-containing protein [Roseicella aquatilis]|nr:CHAP domain-containing protein [Roseicella aquatilis]
MGTTLAVCVLLGSAGAATEAEAARTRRDTASHAKQAQGAHHQASAAARKGGSRHGRAHAARNRGPRHATLASGSYRSLDDYAAGWRNISCVPYARSVTGMEIRGNGGDWWRNAAGSYHRGSQPEPGSVMAFRAIGRMRLGHVAVVSRVLGPRHVLVDHANWGGPGIRKGTVMHNVGVVDVSPGNDWSAVRVQLGHDAGSYGSVYPIYGFIHNRPEDNSGVTYAAARPMQRSMRFEQLAEMPIGAAPVSFEVQDDLPLRSAASHRRR